MKAGFGKVPRVRVLGCSSISSVLTVSLCVRAAHMDDVPRVHRLRAAVPAAGDVGPVLQLHAVPHRGKSSACLPCRRAQRAHLGLPVFRRTSTPSSRRCAWRRRKRPRRTARARRTERSGCTFLIFLYTRISGARPLASRSCACSSPPSMLCYPRICSTSLYGTAYIHRLSTLLDPARVHNSDTRPLARPRALHVS